MTIGYWEWHVWLCVEVGRKLNLRSERKVQFVHQQLQIWLPRGIPVKANTVGIVANVNLLFNGVAVDTYIGLPVIGQSLLFFVEVSVLFTQG
jgi:ribosomal protein L5